MLDPSTTTHDQVILVDEQDQPLGTGDKLQTHRDGLLHRAFSVFLFNTAGEMLLQRRAATKYHSPGLWSNTCCSHPRPGEAVLDAAHRRLQEEMGLTSDLSPAFSFIYRIAFDNGLIEHELDHVLIGRTEASPAPHPDEADAWRWIQPDALRADVATHPERYTYWFRYCLDDVLGWVERSV